MREKSSWTGSLGRFKGRRALRLRASRLKGQSYGPRSRHSPSGTAIRRTRYSGRAVGAIAAGQPRPKGEGDAQDHAGCGRAGGLAFPLIVCSLSSTPLVPPRRAQGKRPRRSGEISPARSRPLAQQLPVLDEVLHQTIELSVCLCRQLRLPVQSNGHRLEPDIDLM
jgi:hypothetical protein